MFKFLYSNFYDQLSKINPKQNTTTSNTSAHNNPSKESSAANTKNGNEKALTEKQSKITHSNTSSNSGRNNNNNNNNNSNTSSIGNTAKPVKDSPTRVAKDPTKQTSPTLRNEMLDSLAVESGPKARDKQYNRAHSYSLASPKDSHASSIPYPSTYLNLSTPNYFSKGCAPKLPPEELPLKISRPKAVLARSNTLSPRSQSRRASLSQPRGLANKLTVRASALVASASHRTNLNADFVLAVSHSYLLNNSFQSLVHYGDNIGAKVVKCLINENLYETSSLINQDYDIYQVSFFFLLISSH